MKVVSLGGVVRVDLFEEVIFEYGLEGGEQKGLTLWIVLGMNVPDRRKSPDMPAQL